MIDERLYFTLARWPYECKKNIKESILNDPYFQKIDYDMESIERIPRATPTLFFLGE